jgi:Xaa-Pro aminopeptidase
MKINSQGTVASVFSCVRARSSGNVAPNMTNKIIKFWDDKRLARERTQRLQTEMKKRGIGGLLCSEPENIQYLVNVRVLAAKVFVPAQGEPLVIVRPRDIGYVKKEYDHVRLAPLTNPAQPRPPGSVKFSLEFLADLVTEYGLSGEQIGFDQLDISATNDLLDARIAPRDARPIIDAARSSKTQDELNIYRSMARNYVSVMEAFRNAIRPGMNEHELGSVAAMTWFKLGGEDIEDLEVCSGERINPWHRWPTERTVQNDEFVAIDFHGRGFGGLIGDLSRTFFTGKPSPESEDLYVRAHDYLLETTDTLRAGRSLGDILKMVPKVPDKYAGQLYNYNIVHSVGMTFGGSPEINRATKRLDTSLEPNQVLTIESYFGEVGSPLAVKLERMVVVRDGVPEVLDYDVPLDSWRVS